MPVFNWRPTQPNADGQRILSRFGPRIQVEACVHPAAQKSLIVSNQPVPSPVNGFALIDTGATVTAIDEEVARALQLPVIGQTKIGTADGTATASLLPFCLRLLPWGFNMTCVPGISARISNQGIIALIGMDLLSQCVLIVNGPDDSVTLAH